MANKTSKPKSKRLSKGYRKFVRRLKQAAREATSPNNPQPNPSQPKRVHKKQDNPNEEN